MPIRNLAVSGKKLTAEDTHDDDVGEVPNVERDDKPVDELPPADGEETPERVDDTAVQPFDDSPGNEEWVQEFADVDLSEGDDLDAASGAFDGINPSEGVSEEDMNDLLACYFSICTEPTDEQIHLLAGALGMLPEELERHIYRVFAMQVGEEEVEDEPLPEGDEIASMDP